MKLCAYCSRTAARLRPKDATAWFASARSRIPRATAYPLYSTQVRLDVMRMARFLYAVNRVLDEDNKDNDDDDDPVTAAIRYVTVCYASWAYTEYFTSKSIQQSSVDECAII